MKKNIFLDFTSLLDVTLIIIFFFVIFSHMEGLENAQKTEDKRKEMEAAIADAADREAIAGELAEQLKSELEMVRDEDERGAANLEELMEFAKSGNIKLILEMKDKNWTLKVSREDRVLVKIERGSDVRGLLTKAMQEAGYAADETLLCEFVFDGSLPGTASAYREIRDAVEYAKNDYKYLYCSETDLSVGEEE